MYSLPRRISSTLVNRSVMSTFATSRAVILSSHSSTSSFTESSLSTSSFKEAISESWESTASAMLLICVCCVSKSYSTPVVEQLGFDFEWFNQDQCRRRILENIISPCTLSLVELRTVPIFITIDSNTWTRSSSWFTVNLNWTFSSSNTKIVPSVWSTLLEVSALPAPCKTK